MTHNSNQQLASCELANVHGGLEGVLGRFGKGFRSVTESGRLWSGRPHGAIETAGWATANVLMPFAF